jgi:hypothetical protein
VKSTPTTCTTTKDTLLHTNIPHHHTAADYTAHLPPVINPFTCSYRRLQSTITPGITDTPAAPSVVNNIRENQSTEAEEQTETIPRLTSPSPPAGPGETTPAIDDSSVDPSAVVSDTTQNIAHLRRALGLVDKQETIALTENPGNTYPSSANETKESKPSNKKSTLNIRKRKGKTKDRDDDPRECIDHLKEETILRPRRMTHHQSTPQTTEAYLAHPAAAPTQPKA